MQNSLSNPSNPYVDPNTEKNTPLFLPDWFQPFLGRSIHKHNQVFTVPHLKVVWVVTAETIITFGFKRYNTSLPHSLTNIVKKKSRTFTKKAGCRRQSKSSPLSIHKTLNLLTLTQLQPSHPKHYIVCFILLFCHYLHGGLSPTNLVRMQIQSQLSPGGESAGTVIPPPRHPQLRPAGPSHASPWQFAAAHLDSSGRESKM